MTIPALHVLSDADLADLEAAFAEDAHDPDLTEVDHAAAQRAQAAVRAEQDRRALASRTGIDQIRAAVRW